MPSLFNILRSHNKTHSTNSSSSSPHAKKKKSNGIFRTKENDGHKVESSATADEKRGAQTIEAVITYSLSEEDEDGADDSSPVSCDSIRFPNMRDLKGESTVYKVDNNITAFFRETTASDDNTIVEVEGVTANANRNGRQVIDTDTELLNTTVEYGTELLNTTTEYPHSDGTTELLNTTVEYGTELLNTTMEEYPSNDDTTELLNTTVEYGTELLNTTIEYATSNEGGRTTEGETTKNEVVNTLISFLPSLCSDLLLDEVELSRSDVVSTTKDDATNNDDAVVTKESALISDGLVVETTTTTTTIATVDDASDSKDSSSSSSSSNQLQLKNDHMVQTAYEHQEMIHQLKQADEDTKILIAHKDQEIRQLQQASEEMKSQITNQDEEMHQLQQQANEDNNKIKKYGTLLSAKDQELATIKKILEEMDSNDSIQINHVMQVAHKHKEMIDQFKQAEEETKIKYVQLLAAQDEEIIKIKKVLTKVMSGLS